MFSTVAAIVGEGPNVSFEEGVAKFQDYLTKSLQHPCYVTGREDFRWEEYWVFGHGDPRQYKQLRRTRPSYRDTFTVLAIEQGVYSEWMLFGGEDLAARVRRKSDGKEFKLGLAELKAVDLESKNHELLDDDSRFFSNNR